MFVFIKITKLKKHIALFRGSSPKNALFNHATFSQAEAGATVPLNCVYGDMAMTEDDCHDFHTEAKSHKKKMRLFSQ
jgi:hypothetical protein